MSKQFGKYVTDKKLKECCHEYDTNINESLNNIVSKYAPKNRHNSKSIDLHIHLYLTIGIYLVGHHYVWKATLEDLHVPKSSQEEKGWIVKDVTKVKMYGYEHKVESKSKRKTKEKSHWNKKYERDKKT